MTAFRLRSNSYHTGGGGGGLQEEWFIVVLDGPRIPQSSLHSSPVSSNPNSSEKRHASRASLLVMASDALNFKFGRRRTSIRQPVVPTRPMPIILPEVIEISAAHIVKDEEVEERERLREEAAQSLGLALSPGEGVEHGSILDSLQDEVGNADDQETLDDSVSVASTRTPNHLYSHSAIHPPLSPLPSTTSIPISPSSPRSHLGHGRNRSGSMPAALPSPGLHHTRSSSLPGTSLIPPFPSTPASLKKVIQLSSTLPKYYPSSSLRIFALSKQWKTRFVVLTTPPTSPIPTLPARSNPSPSYLHLFKSAASEDREFERLEINEDSVVFVSEEDVGGRKHVIKVGGVDVGALRKDLNHEESGRTMWFLQINDSAEAQKWITNIKSAILNQRCEHSYISAMPVLTLGIFNRAVRAGLGQHSNSSGVGVVEPRGDMDVMLSIRAQGMVGTPVSSPSSERPGSAGSQKPYAPSVSSVRSQPNGNSLGHSNGAGAVSAIKGLFTGGGNRPRSSSRATSLSSDPDQEDGRRESVVSSTGSSSNYSKGGNTLMSLLRSNTIESAQAPNSTGHASSLSAPVPIPSPTSPHLFSHMTDGDHSSEQQRNYRLSHLERKIIEKPGVFDDETEDTATPVFRQKPFEMQDEVSASTRAIKTMSAISLQPPPRKRWTTTGSHHPFMTAGLPEVSDDIAATQPHTQSHRHQSDNLSMHGKGESASSVSGVSISPGGMSGFSFGTPEQRPRSPSVGSISTIASGENGRPGSLSGERASINTKRSSGAKRWSRQLPQRLTPPSGPPPAAPTQPHQRSPGGSIVKQSANLFPYATMDRSPSRSSHSSISNGIPSFSKRASGSSAFSVNTVSTSQSHGNSIKSMGSHSRPASTHRASLPPRPAPTFALPPAPVPVADLDETSSSHSHTNSVPPSAESQQQSFRDSIVNRPFRLSLTAPRPPPSGTLPLRPDELERQVRRRTGSSTGSYHSTNANGSALYSIPASPVASVVPLNPLEAPSPPPAGPLPPTPSSSLARKPTIPPQSPTSASTPSRASSLKQRLRILSAPPSAPYAPSSTAILANFNTTARPQLSIISTSTHSPIGTPHSEKSSFFQNTSDAPTSPPMTPSFPTPKIHSIPPPEPEPEMTPLLPPPRRGPKRMSLPDVGETSVDPIPDIPEEATPRPFDKTRRSMPMELDVDILSPSISRHESVEVGSG
ncbi:hypothetical protein V5O48_001030 [Marasmius crinis-equi]|uniref:PH domain-containing protein n=1 Tax=Marasmius crinis-equi TaxID=585013 RepID=A0ABR3G040_9AGAR